MKTIDITYSGPAKSITHLASQQNELRDAFVKTIERKDIGFYRLDNLSGDIVSIGKMIPFLRNFDYLVHIGLGGSVLGPKAMTDALKHSQKITGKEIFYLDNLDPDDFYQILDQIKFDKTLFYIVSKSGETLETKAMLHALLHRIESLVGNEDCLAFIKKHLLVCTDEKNGFLRAFCTRYEITTLALPADLGGRFSVLSPVGLIPLAFIDMNFETEVTKLKHSLQSSIANNEDLPALIDLALVIAKLYQENQIGETVFMPYVGRLKTLALWFSQLWGESLGKINSHTHSPVGLTPLAAIGTSDQHSLLQLMAEGPKNKFIIFLQQSLSDHNDRPLPALSFLDKDTQAGFQLTQGNTFFQLRQACLWGTTQSLAEVNVPACTISFESLNSSTVGKLFWHLEGLTVLVSLLLKINAFDQPGVERGKILAKEFLSGPRK
jgi:glucose-6-phosphate isomerase